MANWTKYTGKIKEHEGWKGSLYQLEKDDGSFTKKGTYEAFFKIGEDRFVVFPYWNDEKVPVIMTAAQVLDLVAVR